MTVQDLINKLNAVEDKSLPVVLRSMDPTDYTYVIGIDLEMVNVEEDVCGDHDNEPIDKALVFTVDF